MDATVGRRGWEVSGGIITWFVSTWVTIRGGGEGPIWPRISYEKRKKDRVELINLVERLAGGREVSRRVAPCEFQARLINYKTPVRKRRDVPDNG